jgi:RNA polymerase sigma factor for flagellar operon FliA
MAVPPDALFLEHRALIESVIRFVCRTRGLRGTDAEEFAAEARLRLVESDYEVLRKFQGRSSLQTYLTVVLQRLALDYQAARWGRWRPSMTARRAGASGIRLEQLLIRDGLPLEDALQIVERELGGVDRDELRRLAARFPLRMRRRYVGEELLEAAAADMPDAEQLLVRADEAARFERVKARLEQLLATLDVRQRLVLRLRFEQGMRVADIARLQQLDQKRLYREIDAVLAGLRAALEAEGVDASAVRTMLASVESDDPTREPASTIRLYERNTS